jgi:hypothetical protein
MANDIRPTAKKLNEEKEEELREKYEIPQAFNSAWELSDGRYVFDFCDQSLMIHPDGRAELHCWTMPNDWSLPEPTTRPW